MGKLKGDIYTKSLVLTLTPVQWAKLRYIARRNKKSVNGQLRMLTDYAIAVYEKNMGEIEIPNTNEGEPPPQ